MRRLRTQWKRKLGGRRKRNARWESDGSAGASVQRLALPSVTPTFISATAAQRCMPARTMRFLRTLHLYLGCLFAPMLIFFAVTGSWQLFNWHESKKDLSYAAPPALAALSFVHKDAHIPGTPGRQPTPLRYFMLSAAAGLVATAGIGVVMAYRFSQRPMVATACFARGNRAAGGASLDLQVAIGFWIRTKSAHDIFPRGFKMAVPA